MERSTIPKLVPFVAMSGRVRAVHTVRSWKSAQAAYGPSWVILLQWGHDHEVVEIYVADMIRVVDRMLQWVSLPETSFSPIPGASEGTSIAITSSQNADFIA